MYDAKLRWWSLFTAVFLVGFLVKGISLAQEPPATILFSEVLMGSPTNASDEFIELFNASGSDIDLSGWQISYKSATGTTWYKKATIEPGKVLAPNSYYLIATLIDADTKMSSGLAQTGGNLRITDSAGNVIDKLAWGNGDSPLGQAADYPQAGESLSRLYNSDGLSLKNTNNNFADFAISSQPTPGDPPLFDPQLQEDNQTQNQTSFYPSLILTELFPDPASPQTDNSDEFIEIYNPNDFPVSLKGWSLQDSTANTYWFSSEQIAAGSYLAIYSKDSNISLNNDGDVVSLFNPSGQLVDQTSNYGNAKEGLSWGLTASGWGWTVSPTPSSPNSQLYDKPLEESSSSAKSTGKKKAKSIGAKKSKIASSKSPKLASVGKQGESLADQNSDDTKNKNLWNWLLITLGAGTILYGIYEYRPEIKSYYYRIRRKLSLWRKAS